jgi:hypothetical protein
MQNAVGEPADAVVSDGDMLLAAFDSHLQHVAGLMPGTRVQYLRHVTLFVNELFDTKPFADRQPNSSLQGALRPRPR